MKKIPSLKLHLSITLLCTLLFIVPELYSQDADAILKKMDNTMFSPKDKQANMKMILKDNKSGKEKVREGLLLQKGTEKRLYKYTAPESQAGIATLSLPGDIMWLYMPAFGKPKKISLLAKSQKFTGTDFSYEDMNTYSYFERYSPKMLLSDDKKFTLELTPRSDKSKYSKLILTVDKLNYYPIKIEYYNRGGEKFKEAAYTYVKIGKYWNAKEVKMTDIQKQHSTTIILSDVKFDQGLTDEDFTVESLIKK
jgi:outer membrane lipoprotein-sorting protein